MTKLTRLFAAVALIVATTLTAAPLRAASIVNAAYRLNGVEVAFMIYSGEDGGPTSARATYWKLLGAAPESAHRVTIKPDQADGKTATLKGEISVSVEIRNKFKMGVAKTDELTLVRDAVDSTRWYLPAKELTRISTLIVEKADHAAPPTASGAIPPAARFDHKEITDGRHILAGRLSLRRQFLGTRATPSYQDFVQFHSFNGEALKFTSFSSPELEARFLKQLADGRSLPVIVTVQFEQIHVGHDGINMNKRLVARIQESEATTAEAICTAAETAGSGAADSEQFKATLAPDLEKDGVTISLGEVIVRSKSTPRGHALAIHGIEVANTTSEVATIEINGVTILQEDVSQRCRMSERSKAPHRWQVDAGSWSDGNYEKGQMPQTLWFFDPSEPIDPDKNITVQVEFKLNGGEPMVITRAVDPT